MHHGLKVALGKSNLILNDGCGNTFNTECTVCTACLYAVKDNSLQKEVMSVSINAMSPFCPVHVYVPTELIARSPPTGLCDHDIQIPTKEGMCANGQYYLFPLFTFVFLSGKYDHPLVHQFFYMFFILFVSWGTVVNLNC